MTIQGLRSIGRTLRTITVHPAALVLMALIVLLSDDLERRVLIAVLILMALAGAAYSVLQRPADPRRALPDGQAFDAYVSRILEGRNRARSACLVLRPDDPPPGARPEPANTAKLQRLAEQIRPVLREDDFIAHLYGDTIAIALSNRSAISVETAIQVALRLQRRIDMPGPDGAPILPGGIRIGIALSTPTDTAGSLRVRAARALDGTGPGAIRCEAPDTPDRGAMSVDLARDLAVALERGEIIGHFQPQICTDTGRLTGVEALARWQHPQHGLLMPGQFLGICEAADMEADLSVAMMGNALAALAEWDRAGLHVPRVSVNFSPRDLGDPTLADRLRWMLDAADMPPHRLGIEVLESVLCVEGDRNTSRTLNALRDMGCFIDLDDFGTGSASITSIRRFAVERLKIDRSFVRGVDHDPAQRGMVTAILTMAEQLEIDTLAEGIETPEEFAMLAQLGCRHAQGFGIARPMPASEIPKWAASRAASPVDDHLPEILRRPHAEHRTPDNGPGHLSPNRGRTERRSGRGRGKTA